MYNIYIHIKVIIPSVVVVFIVVVVSIVVVDVDRTQPNDG